MVIAIIYFLLAQLLIKLIRVLLEKVDMILITHYVQYFFLLKKYIHNSRKLFKHAHIKRHFFFSFWNIFQSNF